ncbi:hypothetical protein L484_024704 [Morus notabilis]|uniref:Uncharacterized protein n=1 Tax=Morus notabilis TaxID=981085 RepID=W9RT83_9ROSA|nr:hypothetical protein L484_024704 [Morus notabilis]
MKHKLAFRISILLLVIILSVAAPATRSLVRDSNKMEKPNEVKLGGVKFELEEGFFEGRMDFEKTDYSGVGANPEHDPKPPAKVLGSLINMVWGRGDGCLGVTDVGGGGMADSIGVRSKRFLTNL